jgi:hypothetical protein
MLLMMMMLIHRCTDLVTIFYFTLRETATRVTKKTLERMYCKITK